MSLFSIHMVLTVRGSQGKLENQESEGILHSKVRENSEGLGKLGNLQVPGCER